MSKGARVLTRAALRFLVLVMVFAVSASGAEGQQTAPKRFAAGIGGGFARGPGGEIGYHALATLQMRTPLRWMNLRLDGMFADWGGTFDAGPRTSLSLNAVAAALPNAAASPYLIGGGGWYYKSGGGTQPGWTLGAGLKLRALPGVSVETRLHVFARPDNARQLYYERLGSMPDKWVELWTPIGLTFQF